MQKIFIFTSNKLFNRDNRDIFEKKFIDLINNLKQIVLINKINTKLSEQITTECNETFKKMVFLLEFLDDKFKEKKERNIIEVFPQNTASNVEKSIIDKSKLIFVLEGKRKKGGKFEGKGYYLPSKKFVILKGSYTDASNFVSNDKWSKKNENKIKQLIEKGILIKNKEYDSNIYKFSEDTILNSPSWAASILRGQNTNGRIAWKEQKSN